MTRVLLTGGTGGLGRQVVERLPGAGYAVRVLSRRAAGSGVGAIEHARADLETGMGLPEALDGVDVVLHAASSPSKRTRQIDVEGTGRLLQAARASGVGHVIYISIVGIDHIPYPYYRYKLAAEALVREAGLPWSILRATQFHALLDGLLQRLNRLPLLLVPTDLTFQPIDTGEVAARLVEVIARGPGGRLPDIGGPEVLTLGELARAWMAARGERRRMVSLPLPGRFAAALRAGRNTCPDRRYGRITWSEWLQTTYPRRAVAPAAS